MAARQNHQKARGSDRGESPSAQLPSFATAAPAEMLESAVEPDRETKKTSSIHPDFISHSRALELSDGSAAMFIPDIDNDHEGANSQTFGARLKHHLEMRLWHWEQLPAHANNRTRVLKSFPVPCTTRIAR